MPTRDDAQRRADQIGAFRAEAELLAREGAPALDAQQLAEIRRYHDALRARLAREHDVDRTADAADVLSPVAARNLEDILGADDDFGLR